MTITQILVQDLPIYIDPKTSQTTTVDENFILSLFKDENPLPSPIITVKPLPDGNFNAYSLVSFENSERARQAISKMNYTKLDGVPIRIKLWNSQTRSELFEGKGKILIKNFPKDINVQNLEYTMNDYGEVIDCEIPHFNGKNFFYGIVQFRKSEDAKNAIKKLNGTLFNGHQVEVSDFFDSRVKKIEFLNKNFKQLTVFSGMNDKKQLFFNSNSMSTSGDKIVCPPLNYPIQNEVLSHSIYSEHSVTILKNKKALAIGSNEVHQINHSSYKLFESKTAVGIELSKKSFVESFSSAVCGVDYTLYLCCPTAGVSDHEFLAVNSFGVNNGKATVFDNGKNVPVALFGGKIMSASINNDGSVTLVNGNTFCTTQLPKNEPVIQLACGNKEIIALSKSGHLHEAKINNNSGGNNRLNFAIIRELAKVEFVCVSGTSKHFLAVDVDGNVYSKGENECGQLGMKTKKQFIEKFVMIDKFTDRKIVQVFAGADHSLFLDEIGRVYACGSNEKGQLMINEEPSENHYKQPVETVVKKGATFCIAGDGISLAFVLSKPPSKMPNMKITNFK